MSSDDRRLLLSEMERRFIPFLIQQGFVQHGLTSSEQGSSELLLAFPLGYLKRPRGDSLELIEVQFDKNGRARFVINVGVVPPEGVTLPWGHFTQNDVRASGLPESYRLYSRRGSMTWFSTGWYPFSAELRAAKTVDRAIDLYDEVNLWFSAQTVGPHLRRLGVPHAAAPT